MKRKILTMIAVVGILCMALTGCGASSGGKAGLYQSDGKFISWKKLGIDVAEVEKDANSLRSYWTGIYNKEGKLVFPNDITKIGDNAFAMCNFTSIDLSNTKVTSIGEHAFTDCKSLTSMDLPNTLTSIGIQAFWGCGFKSIDLSNTKISSIENAAFCECYGLTSIDLPDTLTSIEVGAFSGCRSLTSIDLPDNITSIGDNAFSECISLTNINYAGTMEEWNAIDKSYSWHADSTIETITCSDGVITLEL